jgi:hypothetical protein
VFNRRATGRSSTGDGSDKGLDKTEEKLRSWGKLSTTNDLRARK